MTTSGGEIGISGAVLQPHRPTKVKTTLASVPTVSESRRTGHGERPGGGKGGGGDGVRAYGGVTASSADQSEDNTRQHAYCQRVPELLGTSQFVDCKHPFLLIITFRNHNYSLLTRYVINKRNVIDPL